jgi:hypothetical protein
MCATGTVVSLLNCLIFGWMFVLLGSPVKF